MSEPPPLDGAELFGGSPDPDAAHLPPWTIRCTWRVTDARDEPFRTYHGADCEAGALDRAIFVLDHYRRVASDELICVDILHPGGWWADVPSRGTGAVFRRARG